MSNDLVQIKVLEPPRPLYLVWLLQRESLCQQEIASFFLRNFLTGVLKIYAIQGSMNTQIVYMRYLELP